MAPKYFDNPVWKWTIWFDLKQGNLFLVSGTNKSASSIYTPKGIKVGWVKADNPEKYGCVKIGLY